MAQISSQIILGNKDTVITVLTGMFLPITVHITNFKVNGYTFSRNISTYFFFASLPHGGQLLRERICSSRSKLFPLRVTPFKVWILFPWSITKVDSLYINAKKTGENIRFTLS